MKMINSLVKVRGDRAAFGSVAFKPYYSGPLKSRENGFLRGPETARARISLATNTNTDNFSTTRDAVDVCDTMLGLSVNGAPENTGVTSFVQESCTSNNIDAGGFTRSVYPVDGDVQDATRYFARPVALSSGSVPTSLRSRFFVYDYRFSDLLSLWTNGQARLKGVFGIRATTVFTLQVACTPFHQGVLAMGFQYASAAASLDMYSRGSNSATVTNLPHVRLDLSSDTMVQLRVPYIAAQEYQSVDSSVLEYPFGHISLNAILGVASVSGISAPTYQLYVHLEDIELFGAKPQNVVNITLNAGRKIAGEYEDESKPYSSAAHAASRTVRFLGKGIPSLSSIAGPSAWFLEKAAGAIKSFGYSKVPMIEPVVRMVDQQNVGECNVDNPTSLVVAGPIAANTLRVSPVFGGSDTDEMSLKYVTSSWSQIATVPINTTLTSGTMLYATPVTPMCFWFRGFTTSPATNKYPPPLSASTAWNGILPSSLFFASQFFKFWRGTIKFRFTFGKSKLHGGRVMVAFNPYLSFSTEDFVANNPLLAVSVAEYGSGGPNPFAYSAVFNLRDGNVFEFEVPYMSPLPWTGFSSFTGTLVMYTVDPLQAPSVVSSNIGCLVEVAGGDDFELANAVTARFAVSNTAVALNSDRKVEVTELIKVPGGYVIPGYEVEQPLDPAPPPSDVVLQSDRKIANDSEVVPDLTIGESINSVKQLIMMPHVSTMPLGDGRPLVSQYIAPWNYVSRQPFPPAQGQFTLQPTSLTNGGMWATCYAFARGGTDIHAYARNIAVNNGESSSPAVLMTAVQVSSNGGAYRDVSTFNSAPMSNNSMVWSYKNVLHAKLPWFSPFVRAPSWGANAVQDVWNYENNVPITTNPAFQNSFANAYPSSLYQLIVKRMSYNTSLAKVTLYTSASDDAMLSMYMGPPPLWIPYSGNPGTVYDFDTTQFRLGS